MVLFKMGDCRFCGANEGIKIDIFDAAADHVSKIEMLLPLQMVASEEGMPKFMCHRCMHSIDAFYEFRRKCLSMDLKWRARLIILDSNSTYAPEPSVAIKIEPPDSPIEIISENTSSAANCGWSYTSESDLPKYGAVIATVMPEKQEEKKAVVAVSIEEDKSKCEDPGKAVLQNNTANTDVTPPLAKQRKKPGRKKATSPPKDLKHKKNEKKNSLKNETKSDRRKSALRTAVTSPALPENISLTTSHVKTLQVTPNLEVQKVSPSKTPLPEKTIKSAKVQKPKLNVAESAPLLPQTSSKEPSNHTASQVRAEKPTATVSSKINPRNHQKVTSLELPKPPTDSEKPLPPHIIKTSIPNVCSIFTCSLCERTFTSRSLACCHNDCKKMKNISSNEADESGSAEGIYACSHCDMKFTRYASLVPHEETHSLNQIVEDSDTLSSSSDEETSRKKKKKCIRSSLVVMDDHKKTANAFA